MASTTQIIQILIQSRAALGGINTAINGVTGMTGAVRNLTSHLRQSDQAAQGLANTLKTGVLYAVGDRLVSTFGAVPAVLRNAAAQGVQFNTQMEVAARGIAVAFRANRSDIRDFPTALKAGQDAVQQLLKKANESSADFGDLLGAYQANAGLLFKAGVRDLNKQLDLLALIGDAAKTSGLGGPQIMQETRALLTGDFGPDATIANQLFQGAGERAAFKQALAAGQGFDLLMRKLKPFKEASKEAAENFDVMLSNFKAGVQNIAGDVFKPLFDELKRGLKAANAAIASGEFQKKLMPLGELLGRAARAAVDLAEKLPALAESLARVDWASWARGAVALAGLVVVVKLVGPILGVGFAMARMAFFARMLVAGLTAIPPMAGMAGTALAGVQTGAAAGSAALGAMNAATVAALAPMAALTGALAGVAAGLALREMTFGGRTVKVWAEQAYFAFAALWEDFAAAAQVGVAVGGAYLQAFLALVPNIGAAFRALGAQIGDYLLLGVGKAGKGLASFLQGIPLPDSISQWRDQMLGVDLAPVQERISKRWGAMVGWNADVLQTAAPKVKEILERRAASLDVIYQASAEADRMDGPASAAPPASAAAKAGKKSPGTPTWIQAAMDAVAARQAKLAADQTRGWATQITASSASDRLARIGGFVGGAASGAQRESLNLQRAMVNLLREIRNNARKTPSPVLV